MIIGIINVGNVWMFLLMNILWFISGLVELLIWLVIKMIYFVNRVVCSRLGMILFKNSCGMDFLVIMLKRIIGRFGGIKMFSVFVVVVSFIVKDWL